MNTSQIETEIKLWVDDLRSVRDRLEREGAVCTAERVLERNIRYDVPDGQLTTGGTVLRLRYDTRSRLTYKGPGAVSDGVISRFEAEVVVSDFDTMNTILTHLGFHKVFAYNKYRTAFQLAFCEVTLDELPFGSFVEIEGAHADIAACRSRLGLQAVPAVPHSYAGAFDIVRSRMNLSFSDATFETFEGIEFPSTVSSWLTEGGDSGTSG